MFVRFSRFPLDLNHVFLVFEPEDVGVRIRYPEEKELLFGQAQKGRERLDEDSSFRRDRQFGMFPNRINHKFVLPEQNVKCFP